MFGISCKDKRTFILLKLLLPCPINVFFCGFDCILRSVWLGPYWKVSQLSKIFRIDDVVLASSQLHILGEKSDLNNLVPCWQSSEELQNCNLKRGWPSCWLYCKSILTFGPSKHRQYWSHQWWAITLINCRKIPNLLAYSKVHHSHQLYVNYRAVLDSYIELWTA